MNAQDSVAYASLVAGIICFLMYVTLTALAALKTPVTPEKSFHAETKSLIASKAVSVGEVTDLLKALAQVSDSLSKATPSLVALIGSILFLLIASIASGALHGAPAPQPKAATAPPAGAAPPPPTVDSKS